MKILIAGNNHELIDQIIATFHLCQPDWIISVTSSGKECLKIIQDGDINSPDVFISMIQLLDMPVLSLIEKIREDSDIPIMVISDDKDIQMLVKAFNAGANDYILSSFNRAIFIARLKALVRRRDWDIQTRGNKFGEIMKAT
jgi:DNA-binding response OmpR family regulator